MAKKILFALLFVLTIFLSIVYTAQWTKQ